MVRFHEKYQVGDEKNEAISKRACRDDTIEWV